MANHTPTPWELFDHNGLVAIVNPRAKSSKCEIVFWSGFDSSHYPRQAAANAAFIVNAVNSYDALVAALVAIAVAKMPGEARRIANEVLRDVVGNAGSSS